MWTLFIITVLLSGDGEVIRAQPLMQYKTEAECKKNAVSANVAMEITQKKDVAITATCVRTLTRRIR